MKRPAGVGVRGHPYVRLLQRKASVIALLLLATGLLAVHAVQAGSADLTPLQVLQTLLGRAEGQAAIIVWNIRLPRVLAAAVAGAGLALAGCVMQNLLRNPLASPFTLGISQGAAFGAAAAIVGLGAGSTGSTSADAVVVQHAWSVTALAFLGALAATLVVLVLARYRGATPESMVLAGVALGSLFSAATVLLQYFANEVQVASIVFWTFGDLGRASWRDLGVMAAVTGAAAFCFLAHRWDYNALESGEETAQGLGVEVERLRLTGMFLASLVTAALVAFLGIIGFVGLVAPHLMRRLVGGDYRFLLPASGAAGALLLLAADTLARTVIAPVVLPVGALTSFLGAPLFLYLLARGGPHR